MSLRLHTHPKNEHPLNLLPNRNHEKVEANNPVKFVTNAKGQGPFRGDRWSQLVDADLSQWYLKNKKYESVIIKNTEDGIDISSWWIPADKKSEKRTVIVVHGINGSKKELNHKTVSGCMIP